MHYIISFFPSCGQWMTYVHFLRRSERGAHALVTCDTQQHPRIGGEITRRHHLNCNRNPNRNRNTRTYLLLTYLLKFLRRNQYDTIVEMYSYYIHFYMSMVLNNFFILVRLSRPLDRDVTIVLLLCDALCVNTIPSQAVRAIMSKGCGRGTKMKENYFASHYLLL